MKQINESFKKWRYSSLLYLFFNLKSWRISSLVRELKWSWSFNQANEQKIKMNRQRRRKCVTAGWCGDHSCDNWAEAMFYHILFCCSDLYTRWFLFAFFGGFYVEWCNDRKSACIKHVKYSKMLKLWNCARAKLKLNHVAVTSVAKWHDSHFYIKW